MISSGVSAPVSVCSPAHAASMASSLGASACTKPNNTPLELCHFTARAHTHTTSPMKLIRCCAAAVNMSQQLKI